MTATIPPKASQDPNLIALPILSIRLAALTGKRSPGYQKMLNAVHDGALPAIRVGGRWFVPVTELTKAAVALGMAAPAITA